MSVLSPYAENVTGGAGKSPAEDLYYKWMVAAAVSLVALEISYLTLAGFPPIEGLWVGDTHFVIGRDFLNTWMGGRSAFFGGLESRDALRAMVGTTYPECYWFLSAASHSAGDAAPAAPNCGRCRSSSRGCRRR